MDIKDYISSKRKNDFQYTVELEAANRNRGDRRKELDANYVLANHDTAIGDIVTNSRTGETIRITEISVDHDLRLNHTVCAYHGVCQTKKLTDRKDGQQGWCNQNLVSKHIKAGDL